MNYSAFLIVFSVAGATLLIWLVVWNELAERRSRERLISLKASAEEMTGAAERAKRQRDTELDSMAESGKVLKDMEADKIVEAMRKRIRRKAAGRESDRPRFDLDEYQGVVELIRDTFVQKGLEDQRFPLQAYVRADPETKRSVLHVMVMLRSLREVAQADILEG